MRLIVFGDYWADLRVVKNVDLVTYTDRLATARDYILQNIMELLVNILFNQVVVNCSLRRIMWDRPTYRYSQGDGIPSQLDQSAHRMEDDRV